MRDCCLVNSLSRHIGQTVTVFTMSGGLSGSGFTGVLACITDCSIKLITSIGAPPACPIGSECTGWANGGLFSALLTGGNSSNYGGKWLGSITEIPLDRIVSFTHPAV
jgi:hypothetical protein